MLEIDKFNKIIIANWKLNGSLSFSNEYFKNIKFDHLSHNDKCVIICSPIPYISSINEKIFYKGAQDCSQFVNGAYTGEISIEMIKDLGCEFVILGHSERRLIFEENEKVISKKIFNSLKENIIPIFCIGENLQQKKEKLTKKVLEFQILKSLPKNVDLNNIILAYEPVWSIGTGLIPKIEEISDTHHFIKNEILKNNNTKVLYGGSVKANNYKRILDAVNVDGLLIGGASLNLDEFNQILNF